MLAIRTVGIEARQDREVLASPPRTGPHRTNGAVNGAVPLNEPTDERLIAQVGEGDQSALTTLYSRYSKRIYGMALQKLRDPSSAEDVTHDVFVNVWQKAASFKPGRGKLSSWLLTVAHNQIVDTLRRSRKSMDIQEAATHDPTYSPISREQDLQTLFATAEQGRAVRRALSTLTEDQRQVIVLSYYSGYSQTQIAERLRIPLGTVKSRIRLAMARLKTGLIESA